MPRRVPHGACHHAMPTPKSTTAQHHARLACAHERTHAHAGTHINPRVVEVCLGDKLVPKSMAAYSPSSPKAGWSGEGVGEGVGVDGVQRAVGSVGRTHVRHGVDWGDDALYDATLINFRECIRQDRQDRQDREGSGWGSTQCLILASLSFLPAGVRIGVLFAPWVDEGHAGMGQLHAATRGS